MLNGFLGFTAGNYQTTVAVGERRAAKALTDVGAHRLRGLEQLLSMKKALRAVRESSDINRELLGGIQDSEIAMHFWHGGKLPHTVLRAS